MELKLFIEKFADQFDDTPFEKFSAGTVYKDLNEWSSLTALSIIAMVDEELDKRITGADIRNSSTIEELYNLAKSK